MKPSSLAGTQCVAFMGAAADAGFGIWLVDGVLQGRAGTSIVAAVPALEVDVWHHVTFIVKGGSASLYLDGAL
ncbi:MAG: hypothetical protein NTV80_22310, partial [Verrucomicrobia bacterium]|nr:hypothetical protein [Verrucomicrobiota bacterium]